jgi:cyclase
VYIDGGRTPTGLATVAWAQTGEAAGAGEILLTAMNNDGAKNGFALDITDAVSRAVNIPLIASGGAGRQAHFLELFSHTGASAALAASIFHFEEVAIPDLKQYLHHQHIPVRVNP